MQEQNRHSLMEERRKQREENREAMRQLKYVRRANRIYYRKLDRSQNSTVGPSKRESMDGIERLHRAFIATPCAMV